MPVRRSGPELCVGGDFGLPHPIACVVCSAEEEDLDPADSFDFDEDIEAASRASV